MKRRNFIGSASLVTLGAMLLPKMELAARTATAKVRAIKLPAPKWHVRHGDFSIGQQATERLKDNWVVAMNRNIFYRNGFDVATDASDPYHVSMVLADGAGVEKAMHICLEGDLVSFSGIGLAFGQRLNNKPLLVDYNNTTAIHVFKGAAEVSANVLNAEQVLVCMLRGNATVGGHQLDVEHGLILDAYAAHTVRTSPDAVCMLVSKNTPHAA